MAGARKPPGEDEIDVGELLPDLFGEPAPSSAKPATANEPTLELAAEPIGDPEGNAREPPTAFAPLLPEMEPEIWQAGIQALISVPDTAAPFVPAREEWVAEARLFHDESAIAATPARAAELTIAAARSAEAAGEDAEAARLYDEALELAPSAPDALRARARLAEGLQDIDEAHALWARLAVAAESAEERAFYGALAAEWTLARGGALPAVALDAISPGPARALAMVEDALRGGAAAKVATALAAAGRAVGGAFGAALLEQAARFAAVAPDASSSAAYRAAARKLDADGGSSVFARLLDAARAEARAASKALAEVVPALAPTSALTHAVGRWAAGLARRRGDDAAAGALYAKLDASTAAAARDRIDFEIATRAVLDDASLTRLRVGATSAVAAANLAWIEGDELLRRGQHGALAELLGRAIASQPDAVPLGLLAEELAAAADDPSVRQAGLSLWLRTDPARRAEAALALAAAGDRDGGGDGLAARATLQTAVDLAPGSALFWMAAASDARAGRRVQAAAALEHGAASWEASALAPALRACAAASLGAGDPARALAALVITGERLSEAGRALGAVAVSRFAERAGDQESLRAALEGSGPGAEAAGSAARAQLAELAVRRASSFPPDAGPARVGALAAALALIPDHPAALPLYLTEPGVDSSAAAAALAAAGARPESFSGAGRLFSLAAGSTLSLDGDSEPGFARASALATASPDDRAARLALMRAAARLDTGARNRVIAEVPIGDPIATGDADDGVLLAIAEARVEVGDVDRAAEALQRLAAGRFAAQARRASARLAEDGAPGLPAGLLFGVADRVAAATRAALTSFTELARVGRWDELLAAFESAPLQESEPGAATLAWLALVAEGHDVSGASGRLLAAALDAVGRAGGAATPLAQLALARVAESDAEAALRVRAYELALTGFGAGESERWAAAFAQAGCARLEQAAEGTGRAADRWRAALAAEPTFLPAALALRRDAARRGDEAAAAAACEAEAACLLLPAHRVRALLLAATLVLETQTADASTLRSTLDARVLALLRSALAIDPSHEAAFERLRQLLTRQGDEPALSAALVARIEVAQNPFEVTSLRLARADLLAGALADPAGARAELESVLRKQPEHPRALARLSELLWQEKAWAEAGEVYLRRTVVERDPSTLREIFLRLGQIHSERVPDAKRAATAYERVLSVDAENLEALRALSDLYLSEGEGRLALPVTDRLVAREPDPARRTMYRVRLGEILMHAGDLRRAGTELRRAVDEAPRDVAAVSALAHFFERARDQTGRRSVLDRAAGLLRHDLSRGEIDLGGVETLRALASLLVLRERPHAALAAAQLVATLAGEGEAGAAARAATARGGRSLARLRQPDVDERSFPQGLPPGIRQILRLLGPALRPAGQDLAQRLARHGVTRADRRARGTPPRPAFDAVAVELGVGDFDLYVKAPAAAAGPIPLRAEPGSPPAVILGAPLAELGPAAVRFAAARTLRLAGTQLDAILAVPAEEAGALLVAIIRQFVPDYRHPEVREALVEGWFVKVEHLIPRKLKQQVMPFAIESAGPFDLAALHAAVRDGANATGLLAVADLPAALSVVLALSGSIVAASPAGSDLTLAAIAASPEALALLLYAVSDDYDELARALEA
jgi:hypothetical protein